MARLDKSTLDQAHTQLEEKGPLTIDQLDEELIETNREQTREVLSELMGEGRVASTPDWKYQAFRRD